MWTVYKHTAPNGKIYIGITHLKPEYRWNSGRGYKTNKHFYNAITLYGWDNIKHEIIDEFQTQKEAEEKERELIFHYRSYDNRFGYNKALGGHALSEESRKKISDTRRKKQIKPYWFGKHMPKETREKLSKARKGKHIHITEEWRLHIAEAKRGEKNPNYGKPMREASRKALLAAHERPVVQIVNGEEVIYRSAKVAGDITGICNCNITRVCKKQRATAGGYVWKYADCIAPSKNLDS